MAKAQFAGGVLLFALSGLAIGYVLAAGFLTFRLTGQIEQINWFILFNHWSQIRAGDPQGFRIAQILMGAFTMAAILLSGHVLSERLTLFGRFHWQTTRELKKNGFFQPPGKGFVLAKMGEGLYDPE
ncbi:MAG: hypothetical protein Q4G26_15900 [Paracoccus sp. (in: a-proteobacteria)]|nr:hypothetical protein [Paracoccus sp. (in: a-proteobacteria)]